MPAEEFCDLLHVLSRRRDPQATQACACASLHKGQQQASAPHNSELAMSEPSNPRLEEI